MFVRDFQDRALDGAYHTGIFGQSGSGKSVLAAHIMALQLRHPDLAMLVFDPQGQFSTDDPNLQLNVAERARSHGREVQRLSIAEDITLPKSAGLLLVRTASPPPEGFGWRCPPDDGVGPSRGRCHHAS